MFASAILFAAKPKAVVQIARPVERLGAADVAAQRLRAALTDVVEAPDARVLATLRMTRSARDVAARLFAGHVQR